MKLIPMLFSAPMVQALLAGTKTQTRRIGGKNLKLVNENLGSNFKWKVTNVTTANGLPSFRFDCNGINSLFASSPYGKVGDVIWVRETWNELVEEHRTPTQRYAYRADCQNDSEGEQCRQDYIKAGYPYQWKPSLFMPKEAARIFLKITDVRLERLHEISESDAIAEGVEFSKPYYKDYLSGDKRGYMHAFTYNSPGLDLYRASAAVASYCTLWESINGKGSWSDNPFVWVVKFERTEKP